jgi:hypothetical protein
VVCFLIVSTMDVNYILLAFLWIVCTSLEWSLKGLDHVKSTSLEPIQAELLGIGNAVAAVFLLAAIMRRRRSKKQTT